MKDSLLDIRALSARLCIPVGSIRNALWRGQAGEAIPMPIRLGHRLRWNESEIERFLNHRSAAGVDARKASGYLAPHKRGRPTKRIQLQRASSLNPASAVVTTEHGATRGNSTTMSNPLSDKHGDMP